MWLSISTVSSLCNILQNVLGSIWIFCQNVSNKPGDAMNTRVSLKSLSKREAVVKSASFPHLLFIITLLTTGTGHYGNAARGERVTYVERVFFTNLIKIPSLELNLRRGLPASLVLLVLRGQYVWMVPHQALLPTEFSRQAYCHGVPFPCPEFKAMSLNISCTGRWITYY